MIDNLYEKVVTICMDKAGVNLKEINCCNLAERFPNIPVVYIYSNKDDFVSLSDSMQIYQSLKTQYKMFVDCEAHHNESRNDNKIKKVFYFLNELKKKKLKKRMNSRKRNASQKGILQMPIKNNDKLNISNKNLLKRHVSTGNLKHKFLLKEEETEVEEQIKIKINSKKLSKKRNSKSPQIKKTFIEKSEKSIELQNKNNKHTISPNKQNFLSDKHLITQNLQISIEYVYENTSQTKISEKESEKPLLDNTNIDINNISFKNTLTNEKKTSLNVQRNILLDQKSNTNSNPLYYPTNKYSTNTVSRDESVKLNFDYTNLDKDDFWGDDTKIFHYNLPNEDSFNVNKNFLKKNKSTNELKRNYNHSPNLVHEYNFTNNYTSKNKQNIDFTKNRFNNDFPQFPENKMKFMTENNIQKPKKSVLNNEIFLSNKNHKGYLSPLNKNYNQKNKFSHSPIVSNNGQKTIKLTGNVTFRKTEQFKNNSNNFSYNSNNNYEKSPYYKLKMHKKNSISKPSMKKSKSSNNFINHSISKTNLDSSSNKPFKNSYKQTLKNIKNHHLKNSQNEQYKISHYNTTVNSNYNNLLYDHYNLEKKLNQNSSDALYNQFANKMRANQSKYS